MRRATMDDKVPVAAKDDIAQIASIDDEAQIATKDDEAQVVPMIDTAQDETLTDDYEAKKHSSCRRIFLVLRRNWVKYHLLWLLFIGVFIGVLWPTPGKAFGDAKFGEGLCILTKNATTNTKTCVWTNVSSLCLTMIFLISGLQLKLQTVGAALRKTKAIALGYFSIFILTPVIGFGIAAAPKMSPKEFSFGLSIFSIMPTTLSSCIVITGYAQGDVALALLLSVTTNMLAVAILPLTVTWLIDVFQADGKTSSTTADLSPVDLILPLIFTVLIPLIIGLAVRKLPSVATVVDKELSFTLKLISAASLAAIPWMQISKSSSSFSQVNAVEYLSYIFAGIGLRCSFLILNAVMSALVLGRGQEKLMKALVIVGSQKTLPIALTVIDLLPADIVGNHGIASLAVVILQLEQTLMDSILAVRWEVRTRKRMENISTQTLEEQPN